jgi:predicted peroxiredoxin
VTATAAATLDRHGKTITTFAVFDAAAELEKLNEQDVLELLTDDFEPFARDVAAWCEGAGHRLVSCDHAPGGLRFLIEKGSKEQPTGTFALVISSDGLEELLSPLGFALAAALDGMAVHVYIQGPAVRVLTKGFHPRLHGWQRPFSRFAAAGMSKAGHIPAQEKLRQLRSLGANIYVCGPSMQHFKVKSADLIFSDLPVVEYLTFMPIMASAQAQIYA